MPLLDGEFWAVLAEVVIDPPLYLWLDIAVPY